MSKLLGEIIGGTAGALAFFFILIGCLWFYFLNNKASRNKNSDAGSSNQSTFVGSNGDVQLTFAKEARNFTLEELEQATKNFSDNNFVGVGSFGLVYKGLLLDGTVVAIKKRQGSPKQEFVEEVKCLSALWHRNIVTLIGYCQENSLQLLVYDYVPNGSVSTHLYDKGQHSGTKLEFKQRLSVAIGAAKGLSYIHSQTPIQVHNGFKTRNVLVDESFIAKVADAGMVKLLQRIEGSIGSSQAQINHDPEVGVTNDVYGFGIFLLELITGREVERNQSSSHWVETNRDSTEFIDQRLSANFTSEGMKELIDLTVRCLSSNYKERPKLEMVVRELDRILDIEMTLTTVMGDSTAIVTLGNITSFFVVLAPVPTFYRIYKKKSTESFQSIPYAVAVFSATLWLYYGVLTRDLLLLTINAATLLIEATYLAIYLTYAPSKARAFTVKLIFLLDIGLFGAMTLLTLIFLKGKRRINFVGGFCAAFAVSVFVAPLSIIKLVIKTKSVEYMPFGLSFFLTLSALAWFCYGLLLKDFFVALPNVVGFLFGMVQMILYFAYMNARKEETNSNLTEAVSTANHGGTPNIEIEVVEKNGMPEAAKPEA